MIYQNICIWVYGGKMKNINYKEKRKSTRRAKGEGTIRKKGNGYEGSL